MRENTAFADCQTMPKIMTVMMRPTIGIRQRKAEPDADRAEHDRETGQPVHPGVIAVGDQRRALDLAADADAEDGDDLVAEEADDAGGGHRAQDRRCPADG